MLEWATVILTVSLIQKVQSTPDYGAALIGQIDTSPANTSKKFETLPGKDTCATCSDPTNLGICDLEDDKFYGFDCLDSSLPQTTRGCMLYTAVSKDGSTYQRGRCVYKCGGELNIEASSVESLRYFCSSVYNSNITNCGYTCCNLDDLDNCMQENKGRVGVEISKISAGRDLSATKYPDSVSSTAYENLPGTSRGCKLHDYQFHPIYASILLLFYKL